jgi:hypothetical protein
MRKTNWEILNLEQPTAENLTPIITIEGKDYDYFIYGLKSNLPSEIKVEFSIPTLKNVHFQTDGVPIYALRQPELHPNLKYFKSWQRWHEAIKVPAEYAFQVRILLPIEAVSFPTNPFVSLYYEYLKT